MDRVRVFLCFDPEHDEDLRDRLVDEATRTSAGFEVVDRSDGGPLSDHWADRVRSRIASVDEVIVLCGEHTSDSLEVDAELRIAQEEKKPYFLLWGRRECMCTKPAAARSDDGMYSWTPEFFRIQMALTMRAARPREVPESCRRVDGRTR